MKAHCIDKYICCFVVDDEISGYYDDTYTNSLSKAIQYADEIYNDLCDTFCFAFDCSNVKICVLNKKTFEYVYTIDF